LNIFFQIEGGISSCVMATAGGSCNRICSGVWPAHSVFSFIGAGCNNVIKSCFGVIGGGGGNTVSGCYSAVLGGSGNVSSGNNAAILGGSGNNDGGLSNVFIAGSGITASCSNNLHVGQLMVLGMLSAPGGTGPFLPGTLYYDPVTRIVYYN
jgi:hypothetical protein